MSNIHSLFVGIKETCVGQNSASELNGFYSFHFIFNFNKKNCSQVMLTNLLGFMYTMMYGDTVLYLFNTRSRLHVLTLSTDTQFVQKLFKKHQ